MIVYEVLNNMKGKAICILKWVAMILLTLCGTFFIAFYYGSENGWAVNKMAEGFWYLLVSFIFGIYLYLKYQKSNKNLKLIKYLKTLPILISILFLIISITKLLELFIGFKITDNGSTILTAIFAITSNYFVVQDSFQDNKRSYKFRGRRNIK